MHLNRYGAELRKADRRHRVEDVRRPLSGRAALRHKGDVCDLGIGRQDALPGGQVAGFVVPSYLSEAGIDVTSREGQQGPQGGNSKTAHEEDLVDIKINCDGRSTAGLDAVRAGQQAGEVCRY